MANGSEAKAPTPTSMFEESYPKPVALPPRGPSATSGTALAATALQRGAPGTGRAEARVPLIILRCPRRPRSRERPARKRRRCRGSRSLPSADLQGHLRPPGLCEPRGPHRPLGPLPRPPPLPLHQDDEERRVWEGVRPAASFTVSS